MKYGLVLEGGGVRGAFQVGVWKALRKMNIEICAVAGASIGAINGALIAQDEYDTAMKLWRQIAAEDIVALPKEITDDSDIFKIENLPLFLRELYNKNGLDLTPLEDLLNGIIDENKLRSSGVDFGISLMSLSNIKGMYKFLNEIPAGELVDYIIASSSILGSKKINDEKLTDGGLYDNLPVNMLLDKGINDIIAVTVSGIGIRRGYDGGGKNIIRISTKGAQTGIMDFDTKGISRMIDSGYIECLRAFGKVSGDIYALSAEEYHKARSRYSAELLSGLEKAADILGVNKSVIYTFDGLRQTVTESYYAAAQKEETPLVKAVKAIGTPAPLKIKNDTDDAASAIAYFTRGVR